MRDLGEQLPDRRAKLVIGLGRAEGEIDFVTTGREFALGGNVPRPTITVPGHGDRATGTQGLREELEFNKRFRRQM